MVHVKNVSRKNRIHRERCILHEAQRNLLPGLTSRTASVWRRNLYLTMLDVHHPKFNASFFINDKRPATDPDDQ